MPLRAGTPRGKEKEKVEKGKAEKPTVKAKEEKEKAKEEKEKAKEKASIIILIITTL